MRVAARAVALALGALPAPLAAEAVIVVSSRQTTLNRGRILEFSASHKLALVSG